MRALWGVCFVCAGCAIPRTTMLGQSASLLGPGVAELSASAALMGERQSTTVVVPSTGSQPDTFIRVDVDTLAASGEGNLRVGISEHLDGNLHLSPMGLQPALKFGWSPGDFQLALMPTAGAGFYQPQAPFNGLGPMRQSIFGAVGATFIASHRLGAYAAVDAVARYASPGSELPSAGIIISEPAYDSGVDTRRFNGADLGLSVGWSIELGDFSLRPEARVGVLLGWYASDLPLWSGAFSLTLAARAQVWNAR